VARKKKDEAVEEPEQEDAVETEVEAEPEVEVEAPKKEKAKSKKKPAPDGFADFVAATEKKWPDTTVVAANAPNKQIPRMSSGNIGLDIATFGGWPRGRIVRLFGREKSAKSGTCLNTIAQWQKHCGACYERFECDPDCAYAGNEAERPKAAAVYIDVENRMADMWYWVEGHGVDLDRLLVQVPPDGQHVVDFVDAVIRNKGAGIGLIVVDSIAMVSSQEEIEKETVKGRTAPVTALLLNKAFRKWTSSIRALGATEKKKPTLLLINQIRLTMDQFHPEALPGGEGQKYVTSLDVRFAAGKKHYLVMNDQGELEDRTTGYGTRWKPGEDDTPDFVEINYRIVESGSTLSGRFGTFNYWLKPMWEYVKRLDLLQKEGRGDKLFDIEAGTQAAVKEAFQADAATQGKVWAEIVRKLIVV
jgi:RecA/RadA recombinase